MSKLNCVNLGLGDGGPVRPAPAAAAPTVRGPGKCTFENNSSYI
jgi:hypothetical protein